MPFCGQRLAFKVSVFKGYTRSPNINLLLIHIYRVCLIKGKSFIPQKTGTASDLSDVNQHCCRTDFKSPAKARGIGGVSFMEAVNGLCQGSD